MLPVDAPASEVVRQIIAYSWAMVATSLLLIPAADAGVVYTVSSLVLGGVFLQQAYRLRARVRAGLVDARPMVLFHFSITYLSLIFLAVGVDPFVR